MTLTRRTLFVLALLTALFATALQALDIPPKPTAWVTDQSNLLSAAEEQALNEKLEAFARRSGSQFLVFIFPTIGDEAIEDYTVRVAEQWKVREDRAIILFVFVQERKVRVEVGYGLEGAVPDMIARSVIANDIGPRFRTGDYAGGLNAGVDRLIARVEGKETAIPHDVPGGGGQLTGINPTFVIFIILIFIFFILPLMRRGGGCVGCFPIFPGGGGTTFGGGGFGGGGFGGGGGGGWSVGGGWGGGGGGSFGGGGATGGW